MDIIGIIANAIKNRKKEIVSFIISHGGTVNLRDSDVRIGDELSSVLYSSPKNREEFSVFISSLKAEGDATGGSDVGGILDSITGIYGAVIGTAAGGGGPTAADQLRLQLINSNIEKESSANTTNIVVIVLLMLVMFVIGFLVYKKYQ